VRVVVADDVMLTREGIVRLLKDAGIEVVAEVEDAPGLLHQVAWPVRTLHSSTSGCRQPIRTRVSWPLRSSARSCRRSASSSCRNTSNRPTPCG
jgi:hypothetical protein